VSIPFNPIHGLIFVDAELEGPARTIPVRLALDTGARGTTINIAPLVYAGYDPAMATNQTQLTTASGVAFAPRLPIIRLRALGMDRPGLIVNGHTLPTGTGIDGLLGLDFFRGTILNIDFQTGLIEVT